MDCMITVRMDNAAFADNPGGELVRILRKLAGKLEDKGEVHEEGWSLRDINGNAVGEITFAE